MTFTKNVSRCKSSSLANGQHGGTFLHQKDGGGWGGNHNKVLSGLAKEIWDYLIVNRITITTKYLTGILKWGRFSVSISYALKQTETKPWNIPNDFKGSRDSRYRSICIKNVTSVANVHIMETRAIQQGVGCLPTIMEKPERLRISPILPYNESSEKSLNRHGQNNSNNPSLAKPSPVPQSCLVKS